MDLKPIGESFQEKLDDAIKLECPAVKTHKSCRMKELWPSPMFYPLELMERPAKWMRSNYAVESLCDRIAQSSIGLRDKDEPLFGMYDRRIKEIDDPSIHRQRDHRVGDKYSSQRINSSLSQKVDSEFHHLNHHHRHHRPITQINSYDHQNSNHLSKRFCFCDKLPNSITTFDLQVS